MKKFLRWAIIPEAPDYCVCEDGTVCNNKTGKELKPFPNNGGYLRVQLIKPNGGKWQVTIHRLVALSFVPNPDKARFTEINHIDCNKQNNRADNLEWVESKYNKRYALSRRRARAAESQ